MAGNVCQFVNCLYRPKNHPLRQAVWCKALVQDNAGLLLIGSLETDSSEIWLKL